MRLVYWGLAITLVVTTVFQNCAGYEAYWATSDALSSTTLGFRFFGRTTTTLRKNIYDDINTFYDPQITMGSESDPYYSAIFGNTGLSLFTFFDDRVNFVAEFSDPTSDYLAANVGSAAYFDAWSDPSAANLSLSGSSPLHVSSTRTGLIVINSARYATFTSHARLSILLHEGRHSDCTGGLTQVQINKLKTGDQSDLSTCAHTHDVCPVGHSLAGEIACDDHLWGPYSVQYVYLKRIYDHCANCTATDRTLMEILMLDAFEKVIPNTEIQNQTAPPPDMSSSHTEPQDSP